MKSALAVLLLCTFIAYSASAQYLNRKVSLSQHHQPLVKVLDELSRQGGFIFSYNSDLIAKDSIVSMQVSNKTVKQVLNQLFGSAFEYRQKKNYVIIQPVSEWEVAGYVLDRNTGKRLSDVSVYEPRRLVASLTNDDGYFRLKLHNTDAPQYITVRKMSYGDTSVVVHPGEGRELLIPISTVDYSLDSITVTNHKRMEDTWFGKAFLSSKEKIQSVNLAGFFVDKPYQVSVVPGIGTHGRMSSQVENRVSFNILGGYTAGVSGVELGGMFNLVKNNVEGVQVAGLFNVAGGKVTGLQASGLYNQCLDSLKGVQLAGLANLSGGSVEGVQAAGLYNHAAGDVASGQIGGVLNVAGGAVEGFQIGGVANITSKDIEGIQIAGVFNYARRLKGMQIGLINYADSSSGVSLGLINIVPHGYHKLSLYTNELIQVNAAFKSGTKQLYTIWMGGFNPGDDKKVASFGYGLGMELSLGKWVSVNPELSAQHLYLGDWDHANILSKAALQLCFKPAKYLQLFAGPAYSVYYTEQKTQHEGFMHVNPHDFNATDFGGDTWGWLGWTAGISIF